MSQIGYGSFDPTGAPFNVAAGANGVVTGSTIPMQAASLVINAGGTTAALTITLPLNPPDGCVAEISSLFQVTSLTVNAATGDLIVNGTAGPVTEIIPAASGTAGTASNTAKYKYSLNGYINGNVPALNPRTWFRVQ